ncbi:MAG: flagellar basal body-associated FliL family protein [Clostridiales bacterium]|jgi:hypothetical protein|nr:flagellar basal body-associated FliL family protein [Clostridiales bacterium]
MKTRDKFIVIGVLTAFVLIIVILAVFFPSVMGIGQPRSTRNVSIPPVETVAVGADGLAHNVRTKVTLEVDRSMVRSIDVNVVQGAISMIVSGLDYERIISQDGMQYIKDELMNELTKQYSSDDLKKIYITELKTDALADIPQVAGEGTDTGSARRDAIFKGLFNNN